MTTLETSADEREVVPPARPLALAWLLLVGGAIGLAASFTLSLEKIRLLEQKNYVPSCNFSVIFNCLNIMKTDQASLFGFPNPFIGLMGFAVVITLGVVLLAGARLPEWVWAGLQVGATLGFAFVCWLQYESLYVIGSLCPWCMVVWAVTIPIFWYVTLRNLSTWAPGSRVVGFLRDWHALILALWFIGLATLIFFRFFA